MHHEVKSGPSRAMAMGMSSLAVIAVALATTPAAPQQNPPVSRQTAAQPVLEVADAPAEAPPEMIVTGSRIVRDGIDAPAPATVVSMQDILARNPTNIAD